jgi:hypothetical protein
MHRRETIMQAVEALITGLTTTTSNVERSRAWPVVALPALTLAQGQDVLADEQEMSSISRDLTVNISAHAQSGQQLETDLNQVASEVYAAMVTDRTLGLDYVYDISLIGDGDPQIEGDQNKTTGRLDMQFVINYEHNETSTEV